MARPLKQGLDYFPLDTVQDTKTKLIMSKFGADGYMITYMLLCEIYGQKGYYMDFCTDECLIFATLNGIDEELLRKYIEFAVRIGFFDKDMYEKYEILTSEKIQEIYFTAVSKRKRVKVNSKFILCETVFDIDNEVNDVNNEINDSCNTQSKVNESINEIRENENKSDNIKNKSIKNLCKQNQTKEENKEIDFFYDNINDDDVFFANIKGLYKEKVGCLSDDDEKKLRSFYISYGSTIITDAVNRMGRFGYKDIDYIQLYAQKERLTTMTV